MFTTSMFFTPILEKLSAVMRASTGSRSRATTRRKRRLSARASTPSPQVRSSTESPVIVLWAAAASLEACSKARGGRMHPAAAYDGSFCSARARYLTCVATSRAWGTVRSRATSSGSRPRAAAMARCTSSLCSRVYSSAVITADGFTDAKVAFFSVRGTTVQGLPAGKGHRERRFQSGRASSRRRLRAARPWSGPGS